MISVDEALTRILSAAAPMPPQTTDLARAAGRVLTERIAARHSAPPFDNAAMDGFAVRPDDLARAAAARPLRLQLQGEIIAGDGRPFRLEPGKTLRINTGAPLPAGADAVVPIERVELAEREVVFSAPAEPGQHVRRAGEDFREGSVMLEPGRRLDPRAVGLLASLGVARVPVSRKPRVAVLATGDELIEPGRPLGFGQIYDSTRFALQPLLTSWGAEVHDLGRVGDTPEATRENLRRALECDAVVTTGGVSMGSRDFIRPALLDLGAEEVFWKIRQRPGKPVFFARRGGTLCFGLPGNPVSVYATALLYVRAALLKMQGAANLDLPWRPALAAAAFRKPEGLTFFARAEYRAEAPRCPRTGLPQLVPSPRQGSHQFSVLASAAGLVRLPEGIVEIAPGERLDFLEFTDAL